MPESSQFLQNEETAAEKTTFVELLRNKKILIPSLQRSYAQGRLSDNVSEIRYNILYDIHAALKNNNPISLDNIYGVDDPDGYILLDGQQRMTTLFLLHRYLFVMAHRKDEDLSFIKFKDEHSERYFSRFTYHTRLSSKDFCDYLIKKDFSDCTKDKSVSFVLKSDMDFQWSWNNDPTIQSMLVVLDKIHEMFFPDKDLFDNFIDNLMDKKQSVISFFTMPLKNTIPPNELYIKMNARGLALTPFENFKSSLLGFLGKNKTEIAKKLDVDWTADFFEISSTDQNIDIAIQLDKKMLNVIRVCIACFYVENLIKLSLDESNALQDAEIYKQRFHYINPEIDVTNKVKKRTDEYFSFLGLYERDILKRSFDDKSSKRLAAIIESVMNWISSHKAMMKPGASRSEGIHVSSVDLMKSVTEGNQPLTYAQILFFYLTFLFQLQFPESSQDDFIQWDHVLRNLIKHSNIDKWPRFLNTFKCIHSLYENKTKDLMEVLLAEDNAEDAAGKSKRSMQAAFVSAVVREEELKAFLRKKDKAWINTIAEAESKQFFDGQIFFLFECTAYVREKGNEDGFKKFLDQKQNDNADRFRSYKDFYSQNSYEDLIDIFQDIRDLILKIEENNQRSSFGISLRKAILSESLKQFAANNTDYPVYPNPAAGGFILPGDWKPIMRLDFSKSEVSGTPGSPQVYRNLLRKVFFKLQQKETFDNIINVTDADLTADTNQVDQCKKTIFDLLAKFLTVDWDSDYLSSIRYADDGRILLLGGQGKRLDKNFQELHMLLLKAKLRDNPKWSILDADDHGCLKLKITDTDDWILLRYHDGIQGFRSTTDKYDENLEWSDPVKYDSENISAIESLINQLLQSSNQTPTECTLQSPS